MNPDDFLAKRGSGSAKDAMAELMADLVVSETYCPFLVRPSSQVTFLLVGEDRRMHSFQYHALRQAEFYVRGDQEFISLVADGLAVMIQGKALEVMFRALSRQVLIEARLYDGKPMGASATRITRMEIAEPLDKEQSRPKPRLVKE